jgi:Rrf2 family protein
MILSRTIAYAVSATLALAGAAPGVAIPCSVLARDGKMPERFLLQILRTLVNQGLLRSTRGVDGGYCLARPPAEITLCDIVEVFVCPLKPSAAALDALKSTARNAIFMVLANADHASRQELRKLTLADLLKAEATHLQLPPITPLVAPAPQLDGRPTGHH